jgi:hypothetical protein
MDKALDGLFEGIVGLNNAERKSTIAWKLQRPSRQSTAGLGKNIAQVHGRGVPLI